jgi:hypothetical protein
LNVTGQPCPGRGLHGLHLLDRDHIAALRPSIQASPENRLEPLQEAAISRATFARVAR